MDESTKLFIKSEKYRPLTETERLDNPGYTYTNDRIVAVEAGGFCVYTKDAKYEKWFPNGGIPFLALQATIFFSHVFPYRGMFYGCDGDPMFLLQTVEWLKDIEGRRNVAFFPAITTRGDFERVDQFETDILVISDRLDVIFFKHSNDAIEYKLRMNFPAASGFDLGETLFHDHWAHELGRRAMLNTLLNADSKRANAA